jgi:hypothetical protein
MIEAKGRNGYFKMDRAEIWRATTTPPEIHIDIYSKRAADAPPARIQGPEAEIRNLVGLLYDAIIKNKVHEGGGSILITGIGTDQIKLEA